MTGGVLKDFCQYWAISCFLLLHLPPSMCYQQPRQGSELSLTFSVPLPPVPIPFFRDTSVIFKLALDTAGLHNTYPWWASNVCSDKGPCLQTFTPCVPNLSTLPRACREQSREQTLFFTQAKSTRWAKILLLKLQLLNTVSTFLKFSTGPP